MVVLLYDNHGFCRSLIGRFHMEFPNRCRSPRFYLVAQPTFHALVLLRILSFLYLPVLTESGDT